MTERLAQLLHAEADHLDVPAPNAGPALSRGRGLRRRRRLVTGAVAVTVLAVIGGGVLGAKAISGGDDGKIEPAAPFDSGAVFSIGSTVYVDDARIEAAIDDAAIKSLHYTSVGVLVRHGDNNSSDGGGPQRFSMVRPDGSVDRIDVTLEETVHSTDPTQPYLAYALETDAGFDVVVHDLRDDTETARIAIPAADTGGGWNAPPVSLAGDIVYVGTSPQPLAVNWRTGDVQETDAVTSGIPGVNGGRITTYGKGEATIVDVATGETLLSAPVDGYGYFNLSPDGRFAQLTSEDDMTQGASESFEVYDVDTGSHVTFPGQSWDYGWTGTGDLFKVTDQQLMTCDAGTGECTMVEHGITMPPKGEPQDVCFETKRAQECYTEPGQTWQDTLRLGGRMYES